MMFGTCAEKEERNPTHGYDFSCSNALDFARSLPEPTLYEAIKDAEPLTPIAIHKFPAHQRRHYEGMSRFPEGLVILGDALCSFNPIYGQGMTTAVLEASLLNEYLRRLRGSHRRGKATGLAQPLQKALAKVVDVPWLVATSEDFRYPATEGHRPAGICLLHWYTGRVHELAGSNSRATQGFYEVLHMRTSPLTLFAPRILFAVLLKGHRPGGAMTGQLKLIFVQADHDNESLGNRQRGLQ